MNYSGVCANSTRSNDVMNLTAVTSDPAVGVVTSEYPNCVRAVSETRGQLGLDRQPSRRGVGDEESDFGALVYIVVVLIFYSTGVMVMIVRYLKTEKKELEEEAALENFFKLMPDRKQEQEHRVNRVAIHAFHTLTSISYDDDELDDLDIISDASSPQPLLVTNL